MLAMNSLELARLQFGVTTVFHFFLVPVSIGMSFLVAVLQTMHYRTGKREYERATFFFGKLMLISFAVGVVTGIVQEFQFGMNWSNYSRFVGDIFGAPLAMEALIAFFLESTFIGVWLFGRGKISPKMHLSSIWLLALGTAGSAYFIIAANSFMQHPVGYKWNEAAGRMELDSILAVLTNSTTLFAFPHTILGAYSTAAMVMLAVCAYHLARGRHIGVFRAATKVLLPVLLVTTGVNLLVGHFNGQLMTDQQPMKMAAAEALFHDEKGAGLSLLSIGPLSRSPSHDEVRTPIKIPKLASLMATDDPNGLIRGANSIGKEYAQRYGGKPTDYVPWMGVSYWMFRAMIGAGVLMLLIGAWMLFATRKKKKVAVGDEEGGDGKPMISGLLPKVLIFGAVLPFIANSAGWIFTEMGRQPWIVHGFQKTSDAASPAVSTWEVGLTLLGYTAIYTILGLVGLKLFVKEAKHGPAPDVDPGADPETQEAPHLALTY